MKTLIISSGRCGSKFITQQVLNIYNKKNFETNLLYEPLLWNDKVIQIEKFNVFNLVSKINDRSVSINLNTPVYDYDNSKFDNFINYFNESFENYDFLIVKTNRSLGRSNVLINNFKWDKIIYIYSNPFLVLKNKNYWYNFDGYPLHKSNFKNYISNEILETNSLISNLISNNTINENIKNLVIWYLTNNKFINDLTNNDFENIFVFNLESFKLDTINSLQLFYRYFDEYLTISDLRCITSDFKLIPEIICTSFEFNFIRNNIIPIFFENLFKVKKNTKVKTNIRNEYINLIQRVLNYNLSDLILN